MDDHHGRATVPYIDGTDVLWMTRATLPPPCSKAL